MYTTEERKQCLMQRLRSEVKIPDEITGLVTDRTLQIIIERPLAVVEEGTLRNFVTTVCKISGDDPKDFIEECVKLLELLERKGKKFYTKKTTNGRLRTADGKACGIGILVNADGKNQILGTGTSDVNIAWRQFTFDAAQVVWKEKQEMISYVKERESVRERSVNELKGAVAQLVEQGMGPTSAEGTVRSADRCLLGPLARGFKSATDAVCAVRGLEPTKENKKKIQAKSLNKAASTSAIWELGRLRNHTRVMQQNTNEPYFKCARKVGKHAQDNNECRMLKRMKIETNDVGEQVEVPEYFDDMEQARIYWDPYYDYSFRASQDPLSPAALQAPLQGALPAAPGAVAPV